MRSSSCTRLGLSFSQRTAIKARSLATSLSFPTGESANLYDGFIWRAFSFGVALPESDCSIRPPWAHAVNINFWMAFQLLLQSVVCCWESIVVMKSAHGYVFGSPSPYTRHIEKGLAEFLRRHRKFPFQCPISYEHRKRSNRRPSRFGGPYRR